MDEGKWCQFLLLGLELSPWINKYENKWNGLVCTENWIQRMFEKSQ